MNTLGSAALFALSALIAAFGVLATVATFAALIVPVCVVWLAPRVWAMVVKRAYWLHVCIVGAGVAWWWLG